jgi:transposase
VASIWYGGLDVHQKAISAHLFCRETGEIHVEELPNDRGKVLKAVKRWQEKLGELRLCYEASGAGFVLKRWLDEVGVGCEVIAPSLIPRASGDRVKTDRRDARKLATLYQAGMLEAVRVPSQEEETVRALVRLRDELTRDMTRAKNRVLKYLGTLGYLYTETKNWTKRHRDWLGKLPLEPIQRLVLETHLEQLDALAQQRSRIDKRIDELAHSEAYWGQVQRLMSLKGIGLYSAMLILTELGDARRFPSAPHVMGYVGVVPREDSTGESRRRGPITKAGNSRLRWVLTEVAWNQTRRVGSCARLKKHWQDQPAEVVAIAKKAERRLHDKFWKVANRKDRKTAAVAVAREMAGFIWAMLTLETRRQAA